MPLRDQRVEESLDVQPLRVLIEVLDRREAVRELVREALALPGDARRVSTPQERECHRQVRELAHRARDETREALLRGLLGYLESECGPLLRI